MQIFNWMFTAHYEWILRKPQFWLPLILTVIAVKLF